MATPTLPTAYDPASPDEVAPPPPSAPPVSLGPSSVLQPPLSRCGSGPALVILLPGGYDAVFPGPDEPPRPLDPEPLQKWAEEGFAVVAVTLPEYEVELTGDDATASDVVNLIREGVQALRAHASVDTKDRFGLVVYEEAVVAPLLLDAERLRQDGIAAVVTFSSAAPDIAAAAADAALPLLAHTSTASGPGSNINDGRASAITVHSYPEATTPRFVLPSSPAYNTTAAGLAHTRSLVFLRKQLGGPTFDLEAIWEEHCYWEFVGRSVAKTMATMVAEPYVNHVPTMTGGMGREKLFAFYRDHFIFCNPPDTQLKTVSRTVGPDRIIDEFIMCFTHTMPIPALLPRIPVTNKPLSIPMVGIINIRGDRLCHEHIWWDQATALRQLGILPTHLPYEGGTIELPVAGAECARLLLDERDGTSNEMIDA